MDAGNRNDGKPFSQEIGDKEKLKMHAQKNNDSPWLGLGMFGMVGWSVVVPTLIGAAIGTKLDKAYPQSFSWTLSLLVTGLFCGCVIAWHWISREHNNMHKDDKNE